MSTNPPESRLARSGTNAAIAMLGNSSQQIASLVITLMAAGFLGVAEYGIYSLSIIFVEFVVMITYTGFFHFVVNSDEDEDSVLSTMFWIMLAIGFVGGALLIVLAGPLAAYFRAPELAPILRLFGLLQPFASVIGWASAALTRAGQMRRYFVNLIVSNLGGLVVGVLVLVLWHSVFALVAYRAIRIALGLTMFVKAIPKRPAFSFDTALALRAARYAGGLYGSRLMGFLSTFGPDLVVASLFSVADAGLYRFASRLATGAIDIVAQPMRSFSLKSFGAAARHGQSLDKPFAQFLSSILFLSGGVATVLIVLGQTTISALFQPGYMAALGVMQAFSVRAMALSGNTLIEPVFAARGTTRVGMYHNLIWTSLLLVVIALSAPFGVQNLAIAQTVMAALTSVAAILTIGRWGQVSLRPALVRAGTALLLILVYAMLLALGWTWLAATIGSQTLALAAGLGLALALAIPTTVVAARLDAFDLRIFND